jgi:hypothetical protein
MFRSDKTLKRWYRKINKRFFDGQLPNNVLVRWSMDADVKDEPRCDEKYFGWVVPPADEDKQHAWQLVISRVSNIHLTQELATLAHEMCHIATKNRDEHGEAFNYWVNYITERGILKKGALVRGLTLF